MPRTAILAKRTTELKTTQHSIQKQTYAYVTTFYSAKKQYDIVSTKRYQMQINCCQPEYVFNSKLYSQQFYFVKPTDLHAIKKAKW